MTAQKPLANPRLAAKIVAGKKAGLDPSTPTCINAILERIGKLERAQRASIPDQLIRRLDALGKIVANLQESHGSLAQWVHQELAEIRLTLIEDKIPGDAPIRDVKMPPIDVDGFAQRVPYWPSTSPVSALDIANAKKLWPDAARLGVTDLGDFARAVRHAQANGSAVYLPHELLQPLSPPRRWWHRFIPFR